MLYFVYKDSEKTPILLPDVSDIPSDALESMGLNKDEYWFTFTAPTFEEAKAIFDLRIGTADKEKYGDVIFCDCGGCYYLSGICWQCGKLTK